MIKKQFSMKVYNTVKSFTKKFSAYSFISNLKAVYYTVEVHNFDLQEKLLQLWSNNKLC